MKAFILAAGLGTRLKPWTEHHPKALVPVGGVPMLQRIIENLESQGFDSITVNIHHFANQVVEFLASKTWKAAIHISDERECLLDTGGAILHAAPFLCADDRPFLVHNVDILSNAPLSWLMNSHLSSGADATLAVSDRTSSRRLVFDRDDNLCGWHNLSTGELRPQGFVMKECFSQHSFSGIHVMSPRLVAKMEELGFSGGFSVIDFYLAASGCCKVKGVCLSDLKLIDIGKPETLSLAEKSFTDPNGH